VSSASLTPPARFEVEAVEVGVQGFALAVRRMDDCACSPSWTSPSDGVVCAQTQYGCPATACDGDEYDPWCVIDNPGCAAEEAEDGGGWAYCEPLASGWSRNVTVSWRADHASIDTLNSGSSGGGGNSTCTLSNATADTGPSDP